MFAKKNFPWPEFYSPDFAIFMNGNFAMLFFWSHALSFQFSVYFHCYISQKLRKFGSCLPPYWTKVANFFFLSKNSAKVLQCQITAFLEHELLNCIPIFKYLSFLLKQTNFTGNVKKVFCTKMILKITLLKQDF